MKYVIPFGTGLYSCIAFLGWVNGPTIWAVMNTVWAIVFVTIWIKNKDEWYP